MSLLGLDIGTSGCKAVAYDLEGGIVARAAREYETLHPRPGWAELASLDVAERILDILREIAAATKANPVTALCCAAMGEAMTPVGRDRSILGNCILASADVRGGEYVDAILEQWSPEQLYRINPNIPGPGYSLPKLKWIEEHQPELFADAYKFLLWPDLVGFLLGCEPVTNPSHANRTLLFDLTAEDWSEDLLRRGGIPVEKLPAIAPTGRVIGTVADSLRRDIGFPAPVSVVSGAHDQCFNSLGAGVVGAGRAVCGIGTVECITPTYGGVPPAGDMYAARLNIEHHALPGLYVSFIYNQAGSLVRWYRDTFAAAETRAACPGGSSGIYDRLMAEMPERPTNLLVLPYFEMTGAPTFVTDASGAILGLKTDTTRGEILKAILECETMYFVESLATLKRLGMDTSEFVATGGGAKSDPWLQIKADILGVPFLRLANTEAGTLGAAIMAGVATGQLDSAAEAVAVFVRTEKRFEPRAKHHQRYIERHADYLRLYPGLADLL